MIVGLRQKVLTHFYLHLAETDEYFYRYYKDLNALIMWKVIAMPVASSVAIDFYAML